MLYDRVITSPLPHIHIANNSMFIIIFISEMPTVTHAWHVFDLLVVSQILDYWLQFFKPVKQLHTIHDKVTGYKTKCTPADYNSDLAHCSITQYLNNSLVDNDITYVLCQTNLMSTTINGQLLSRWLPAISNLQPNSIIFINCPLVSSCETSSGRQSKPT